MLMNECPKCKSSRTISGHLARIGQSSRLSASFWPSDVKCYQFVFDHGPVLQSEAFACADCGLVWMALRDVTDLRHMLSQAK